jgi:hypothetical protein
MVGVINPNSTQTLDLQIAAAKVAKFELAPGMKMPDGGAPTSSAAPTHSNTGVHKLSTGAVVGISLGVAAFLALCAALFFFIGRSKTLKEAVHRQDQGTMMKPVGVGGPEMGHAQMPPQSPQGPSSPVYRQPEYASPLPPYVSPQPHHAQLNMASGVHGTNSQQWYRQVLPNSTPRPDHSLTTRVAIERVDSLLLQNYRVRLLRSRPSQPSWRRRRRPRKKRRTEYWVFPHRVVDRAGTASEVGRVRLVEILEEMHA